MSETQERITKLKRVMTSQQRVRHEAEVCVLASRYESEKISLKQELAIAERVLCGKAIDPQELVRLKPTKSACVAVGLTAT
ncbi:hypothetical protein ACFL3B_00460 [Gemmatimonadota bacterium]